MGGVIVAGLNLDWLADYIARKGVPEGGALAITDRNGIYLARYPHNDRFVGTKMPGDKYLKMDDRGAVDILAVDGVERIEGYSGQARQANETKNLSPGKGFRAPVTETPSPPENELNHFDIRRLKYAFFSSGPFTFRVEIGPPPGKMSSLTLLWEWSGDWKLTRIVLPMDTLSLSRPTSPCDNSYSKEERIARTNPRIFGRSGAQPLRKTGRRFLTK